MPVLKEVNERAKFPLDSEWHAAGERWRMKLRTHRRREGGAESQRVAVVQEHMLRRRFFASSILSRTSGWSMCTMDRAYRPEMSGHCHSQP